MRFIGVVNTSLGVVWSMYSIFDHHHLPPEVSVASSACGTFLSFNITVIEKMKE